MTEAIVEDAEKTLVERVCDKAFSTVKNLIGKKPETLLSVEGTDQGWKVRVEALERRAVPDIQDVLARYELLFNENAELMGWKQVMVRKRGDRFLPEEEK